MSQMIDLSDYFSFQQRFERDTQAMIDAARRRGGPGVEEAIAMLLETRQRYFTKASGKMIGRAKISPDSQGFPY